MPDNLLLIYSTTDGHTLEICERLRQRIEEQGQRVRLCPVKEALDLDLGAFDKIVIGASIRYGRHGKEVHEFIARHQQALERLPNAFFTVNLVARKPNKNRPETNPYLLKFLRRIRWRPQHLEVFAGKLDYPRYRPLDRQVIRLIMWLTQGPTAPATVIDYTDWRQVDGFARLVAEMK